MPSFTNVFLFSFFYMLSIILTGVFSGNNATDSQALLAFKAAIISDPFQALSSWNETTHVCSWKGVACSRRHVDRVVSINLMSLSLVGSLSPYIGNLSFLKRIDLANNSFHGGIPQEIGHLRRLQSIEFKNNSFSGEIPKNLSQCVRLHYLSLFRNELVGTIFPELSSLVEIKSLGLSENNLTLGIIPTWIGNLTSLVQLALASCGLVGKIPESLGQLRNLRLLHLYENNLTGNIPPQLFNSSISLMVLGFNSLEGTIPSGDRFKLPNLRELVLNNNKLSGEVLPSLSNASFLQDIDLMNNNFSGSVLNNFQKHTNLQYLFLSNNRFMGDINFISSLTNCTKLKVISVAGNLLKGSLPSSIFNLSMSLMFFSVQDNHIYGRIPPGIGELLNLRSLFLGFNYFSGLIPSSIGKLVNLQMLYLHANRFSGHIPPSFGNLTWMNHLSLRDNNITGSIPSSFNNCTNLLILELSHNNLNGAIPREVLGLSTISIFFDVSYNRFTGPLPPEVGLLKNLGMLDLSNNRLSGPIPNALSNCLSLESLHLEENLFEGEIPVGLSALRGLRDLDLSRNHLSGQIPSFLSEFHLFNLNLSFNQFQGEVPTSGVFQNKSIVSIEGNIGLCGGINELALPSCPSLNHSQKKELSNVLKIVVPIGVIVVFLAIIVVIFLCKYMLGRKKLERNNTSIPLFNRHSIRFSYAELQRATSGFSHANFIGAGRFGSVYKGMLDDGKTMVAVKVLNLNVRGASKTLMVECNALRRIRHRNLVKILSVYLGMDFKGHDFKALVYEFKSNGSLEEWLHCNPNEQMEQRRHLTMIQRLNVAIDVAMALEYLHFGSELTIIHGDIKPSNILLDDAMIAYVGDFGLTKVLSSMSKDFRTNESSSFTIKGTIGYVAPEYGMGCTVSIQGDAYSFGVLLLEIFTGIRPSNTEAFKRHPNLHSFVSDALPDNMMDIIDPSIVHEIEANVDNMALDCMLSILRIAVLCSNEDPRYRMNMKNVATQLTNIKSCKPYMHFDY